MKKLTKHQLESLLQGKKHWTEKVEHITKLARSFGLKIETYEDVKFLMEIHCPNERHRLHLKYLEDVKTGRIKNGYTPTDVKGTFKKVDSPVIGKKYHISWAYSAAVFKLVRVEGDLCYLDNPRNKRKELLKCKVSELRHLAGK